MADAIVNIAAEIQIDVPSPTVQFSAEEYQKLHCLDLSEKSGCILVYISSSIPSRQLHCGN